MSKRRIYILVFIVLAALVAFVYDRSRSVLDGPISSLGYEVTIRCPDAGLGTGDNYRADIEINDSSGAIVAQWKDKDGQGSPDGLSQMLGSMTWSTPTTLSFKNRANQRVRLRIPN